MPKRTRPPGTNDADLKLTASEQRNAIERQHLRNARRKLNAADIRLRELSTLALNLYVPKVISAPIQEISIAVEEALEQLDAMACAVPKDRRRT